MRGAGWRYPSFAMIGLGVLLAVCGCSKEDGRPANDSSARDAAPGRLSETEPPSTATDAPAQNEADKEDEPPPG
jgi:hypothetical protein